MPVSPPRRTVFNMRTSEFSCGMMLAPVCSRRRLKSAVSSGFLKFSATLARRQSIYGPIRFAHSQLPWCRHMKMAPRFSSRRRAAMGS